MCVSRIFFFFKQKTAYEMRISDWSSDVCSSDLYEDRARYYADPHFSNVPVEWLISKEYAAERAKLIRPDRLLSPVHPGQAPSHGDTTYFSCADKDGKIGRASCRERVCQYV